MEEVKVNWISIDDKLPEEGQEVVVITERPGVRNLKRTISGFRDVTAQIIYTDGGFVLNFEYELSPNEIVPTRDKSEIIVREFKINNVAYWTPATEFFPKWRTEWMN